MCGDNSYSCPPSLPLVQPLADQQQAALRPATSIPYPIFASLLPSLSLRREVPMVGIQCSLCAKGTDLKSTYIGLLRLSLVLPLGNSPFPWYVVHTSRRRPLPFCSRGGGSQTSVQADSIQGNTALGTWKVWRVCGAITMTHWQAIHTRESKTCVSPNSLPSIYCGDITLLAGVGSRASDTIFHHLQRCLLETSGGDPDTSPRPRVGESDIQFLSLTPRTDVSDLRRI